MQPPGMQGDAPYMAQPNGHRMNDNRGRWNTPPHDFGRSHNEYSDRTDEKGGIKMEADTDEPFEERTSHQTVRRPASAISNTLADTETRIGKIKKEEEDHW